MKFWVCWIYQQVGLEKMCSFSCPSFSDIRLDMQQIHVRKLCRVGSVAREVIFFCL